MTSWACCVCLFFLPLSCRRCFFRSFNRLLGDIYYDPLDVGLAFKQLSFTRQSELSTLDQPVFNSLYGPANGRLADRIGLGDVVLSPIFPPIHHVISSWSLQLSLAGLPLFSLFARGLLNTTKLSVFERSANCFALCAISQLKSRHCLYDKLHTLVSVV